MTIFTARLIGAYVHHVIAKLFLADNDFLFAINDKIAAHVAAAFAHTKSHFGGESM